MVYVGWLSDVPYAMLQWKRSVVRRLRSKNHVRYLSTFADRPSACAPLAASRSACACTHADRRPCRASSALPPPALSFRALLAPSRAVHGPSSAPSPTPHRVSLSAPPPGVGTDTPLCLLNLHLVAALSRLRLVDPLSRLRRTVKGGSSSNEDAHTVRWGDGETGTFQHGEAFFKTPDDVFAFSPLAKGDFTDWPHVIMNWDFRSEEAILRPGRRTWHAVP